MRLKFDNYDDWAPVISSTSSVSLFSANQWKDLVELIGNAKILDNHLNCMFSFSS